MILYVPLSVSTTGTIGRRNIPKTKVANSLQSFLNLQDQRKTFHFVSILFSGSRGKVFGFESDYHWKRDLNSGCVADCVLTRGWVPVKRA